MEKLKKIWRFLTAPEMLLYILFGILTTAVNILSFGLLRDVLQWQLLTRVGALRRVRLPHQ